MTKELKKRLITSIILFILALLCILINYIVFSIAAVIVLFICFDEWCGINYKYFSTDFSIFNFIIYGRKN